MKAKFLFHLSSLKMGKMLINMELESTNDSKEDIPWLLNLLKSDDGYQIECVEIKEIIYQGEPNIFHVSSRSVTSAYERGIKKGMEIANNIQI